MYIRKTKRVYKGKVYTNHLLVESVLTPKGPRQRTLCSLGRLEPAPREQWLGLARKMEAALQGQLLLQGQGAETEALVQRARKGRKRPQRSEGISGQSGIIAIDTDRVETEQHREAGPVHVGHQIWRQLGLGEILRHAGLSERACMLSEVMTLNRLIFPLSELSMPDWIRRTATGDILGTDFSELNEDSLYRNLDKLYPKREQIERELSEREKTLFNLDDMVYLYDLTSTYFEGQAETNPQAKRGYSRDKRPDCKQVLVGLVLNRDGFPKAHEIFEGNRQDLTADEIWRTYMLLTRVEAVFRSMKSPLMERPIFHHLKHRTQTHIFLCILAYHLLTAIEKRFLDQGIHTSWWSIRQQLSTHQVATIVLPTSNRMVLRIRKGGTPEPDQRKIYEILKIPSQVMKSIKTWHEMEHSD